MTLPVVAGWVIDFRTAQAIFQSGSNQRIDHCVGECKGGSFVICHCEVSDFKKHPRLKAAFISDQNCICTPDEDILRRSLNIASTQLAKKRLVGNESAVFVTAIAASRNFGVISDHRSLVFTTVYDLCKSLGIPILSADEYFAAI